jgi:serine/threonine-protein kinase
MADLTGKTIGKYRIGERRGRGGMAEVYRAYQPNLEREVAIKVLRGYLTDDIGFRLLRISLVTNCQIHRT